MKAFNPKNFQILIVDSTDENTRLRSTIATLIEAGYWLFYAHNEEQTLEAVRTLQPDLILINPMTCQIDRLKNDLTFQTYMVSSQIPIIFVADNPEQGDRLEENEEWTVDYLCEPLTQCEILTCIKTHLKLKRNFNELQKAYAHLQTLVNTDALTGVANRRALMAFGEKEFYRTQRYGYSFSVLIIDVDRFKQINDTYGHSVGDRVLIEMSTTISRSLRQVDFFGRFGGEEFLAFLPETKEKQAIRVAQRLCKKIAGVAMAVDEIMVPLTISIGVAAYHASDRALDVILKRADDALYQAKKQGRNRVMVGLLVAPSAQEQTQSAIVSSVFSVSEGDFGNGENPSNIR
jgi:diguanylate cyclase (GGDEF)-like protein